MAGDWIKMRMDLPDDPAVYKLAALTKMDRLSVVGRLYAFWAWADKHAVDGRVDGATSLVVDDVTRFDGFADALVSVKWLDVGDDFISLPRHERHNGESAKERGLKNARQARWREGKDKTSSTDVDAAPSTSASTREEKRREEKKEEGEGKAARVPRSSPPVLEGVSPELLADYLVVRKAKKAGALTSTAVAGLQREADKAGITLCAAVQACCEYGWQGFNAGWYAERKSAVRAGQASGETAYQRQMRERMQQFAPGVAARAPGATSNIIDMEAHDVTARRLG